MIMKRTFVGILILLCGAALGFSQTQKTETSSTPGQPVAENIGVDTAQQKLKEISLSTHRTRRSRKYSTGFQGRPARRYFSIFFPRMPLRFTSRPRTPESSFPSR